MNESLTGKGVLVTRPSAQSGELAKAITAAGGYVYQLPAIEINPRSPEEVNSDAAALPVPDIVIFVSRSAATHGAPAIRLTAATRVAVIGHGTRSALGACGIEASIWPTDRFDSEHLLERAELQDVAGKHILIVRGTTGRELLADTLTGRGATVNYLAAYERIAATPDDRHLAQIIGNWERGEIDAVVVMSVDSLNGLLKILPSEHHELLRKTRLVTPSRRVIQTAAEALPGVNATLAEGPQADHLVRAINQLPQQ